MPAPQGGVAAESIRRYQYRQCGLHRGRSGLHDALLRLMPLQLADYADEVDALHAVMSRVKTQKNQIKPATSSDPDDELPPARHERGRRRARD